MKTDLTIQNRLTELLTNGFELPTDYEQKITTLKPQARQATAPWYVRLMVGIAAWITAVCIIAFLYFAEITVSEIGILLIGLLFCSLALYLNREHKQSDFFSQLSLALSFAGQLLYTVGIGLQFYEPITIALAVILLELVLLALYQSQLHRLFSTLIILFAIGVLLYELGNIAVTGQLFIVPIR